MHWSAYEIFTVLSGLVLLGAGLIPGSSEKERASCFAGGGLLIVFALYVASQDSGTYYFPVGIFVIPPAIAIMTVGRAIERRGRPSSRPDETGG